MNIRQIREEDAADIYRIERESFPDPWSIDGIAAECANALGIALCAEENGCIVGYIFGEYDGESGYISHIAVDGTHRRKGYAASLLAAFEQKAPSGGITLEVRRSNTAAAAFYRKAGFEEIGTRRNFYSVPEREDAAVMMKQRAAGLLTDPVQE